MKKTLLLILLFTFCTSYSTAIKVDTPTNNNPPYFLLTLTYVQGLPYIKVKNLTNVTLDEVYVSSYNPDVDFFLNFGSLGPQAETSLTLLQYNVTNYDCFMDVEAYIEGYYTDEDDVSQVFEEIDYLFSLEFFDEVNGIQFGTYQDLNGNSVVDVGDAIHYVYDITTFFNEGYQLVSIDDDNADVTINNNVATGIHYITQEEIDFGYVYNNASGYALNSCGDEMYFEFCCSYCPGCPNPNFAYTVTSITPLPPHKISGNIKFNLNNDSCSTGLNFPRRSVKATNNSLNYRTFTNSLGNYSINIPNLNTTYTITALENLGSNYSSTPTSRTVNTFVNATQIDYNNNNFCISVDNNFNDVALNFFNLNEVNPGFAANYRLYYQNNGTTVMNGSITLNFDSSKLQFDNATPSPDVINTNTLTWNYSNLLPFEVRYIPVNFMTFIPPIVVAGDAVSFTAIINPIDDDATPINNTKTLNQIAVGSYDPNDKTVLEGAFIEPSQANDYLTYLTRFQNSGTANATFVIIKEILDANLDWTTFTPIAESHNANIEIRNGNELTYTFPDINLPYEEIEPELSNGWMLYKIKLKNNFAIGDIASSTSDIYFDFNPPIITNTVTTQFAPLSITENFRNNFKIIPNPASSIVTISMENLVNSTYEIVSINGKKLTEGTVENFKPIDISYLNNGFYFITITSENSKLTYKLIKN